MQNVQLDLHDRFWSSKLRTKFLFYTAQQWTQVPGAAIDISVKGDELWVINVNQKIYRWTGSSWENKPGAAVSISASPDGWSWMVNARSQIYRWNVDKNKWDLIPGALVQIRALSKDMGKLRR